VFELGLSKGKNHKSQGVQHYIFFILKIFSEKDQRFGLRAAPRSARGKTMSKVRKKRLLLLDRSQLTENMLKLLFADEPVSISALHELA